MENDTQNNQQEICTCDKHECKKFILIAIMTFVGSFLAFYVLMHQMMIFYFNSSFEHFIHHKHKHEINMMKEFEKTKHFAEKEFKKNEHKISAVQTVKTPEEYIIYIDLQKFNNNEKNITFDINNNIVTVSGNILKNKKHSENDYYFAESFYIPEKINTENITKEKIKNSYIITLPIEN